MGTYNIENDDINNKNNDGKDTKTNPKALHRLRQKEGSHGNGDAFSALAIYSQLGISMSMCVALGIIGGIFLDRRFNTNPLFLFIGCFTGTGASFKALYDLTVKNNSKKRNKNTNKK